MAQIRRDADITLEPLTGKTVAVLGFGSQGRAQALNLRDSGVNVVIGLRAGSPSASEASSLGLTVLGLEEASARGDLIALLLPDGAHREVFDVAINPRAKLGAAVVFAHGFNVVYGAVSPREDLQRLLVAPKAIGPQLRRLYEEGKGAAALVAAEPGDIEVAKAYAKALGCGRAAVIESSFREETETDLFGEQAVLCGGMPELARAAFETLVEAGYSPEAAYFECIYEIKLIADMIFERGIAGMFESVSDTAQYGAMMAGPRVIGEESRGGMRALLTEIQCGEFALRWKAEQEAGCPNLKSWRGRLRSELAQQIGEKVRR